ncbi:DUF58 domain-containing protein [Parafrigoribacterium mesophilum]|uniref:DUF58 domain-containing protein n=1 Tax=Parafrigoribacterium mesophilum TaxID=433646 RepID=UPI0031FE33DB
MRLTRRGLWMLVLGVISILGAYMIGRTELVYLGSLLILLPVGALVFLRVRAVSFGVDRRFSPAVLTAGQAATVTVEVHNLARYWSAAVAWRDGWPWYSTEAPSGILSPIPPSGRLFAHRGHVLRYQVTPPRRGVFDIGPLRLTGEDPFGLALRETEVGEKHTVLVVPDVVPLPDTVHMIAADDGSGRTLQRQTASGVDDLMAREYRIGDALRRVHWRASAHRGDLMVRQEEQRSHAEARILLDTRRAGHRDATADFEPESDSLEWAVRFTASLGLHLRRRGFAVHIVETCPRQVATLDQAQEFLASLAEVSLSDQPIADDALSFSPGVSRSLGSMFAVLSDAEDEVVERLVRATPAFDTAIAFLVSRRNASLASTLRAAGWVCVSVNERDGLDAVWLDAARAREAQRAGA